MIQMNQEIMLLHENAYQDSSKVILKIQKYAVILVQAGIQNREIPHQVRDDKK
jgi:hypothetical protein